MARKCPGCRRKMKLTYGEQLREIPFHLQHHDNALSISGGVWYCPFCIRLSMKVRDKFIELHKAEAEIARIESEKVVAVE